MVRNNFIVLVVLFSLFTHASAPGDKRTIYTSGEKVYSIYYQLGQSTILYLGFKPETVICGNKNYFNIEKIKEGITIQPLSNFITNLTVLNQGRRYLFYLTPSKNGFSDTFVDVKWIPKEELRSVPKPGIVIKESTYEINQKLNIGSLEVQFKKVIVLRLTKRAILEFTIKNNLKGEIKTKEIEVIATKSKRPIEQQVIAFDSESIKSSHTTQGRIIVTQANLSGANILLNFRGKNSQFQLQGGKY